MFTELLESHGNELTEKQKTVLELYRDGHSIAEIASVLKTSPAQASDLKYRGLARLRSAVNTTAAG